MSNTIKTVELTSTLRPHFAFPDYVWAEHKEFNLIYQVDAIKKAASGVYPDDSIVFEDGVVHLYTVTDSDGDLWSLAVVKVDGDVIATTGGLDDVVTGRLGGVDNLVKFSRTMPCVQVTPQQLLDMLNAIE